MGKAFLAWMLVATAVAAPATGPREVVQSAVSRVVLAIERADTESDPAPASRLAMQQRRLEVRRIATDLFDFDEISRRALSRHWTARSPEEQAEFVRLFTDLLERTYLGRIESYSGEKIVYMGETVDGPFATVRSKVVTRRRGETPLDYRLHLRDGRWKVYDVLIDHVSFVATYRSEFGRILQKESYAALVDRLRKHNVDAAAFVRSR
ncbi:MAG TPA: ABC transporter substrate-binding protein [Jatrophihabitantaceae bacterium]|nr:ABC transporter substrate-binding protein [Jatrophihabitantaceae bacterium]